MSAERKAEDEGIPDLDPDYEEKRKGSDLDEGIALPGDRPLESFDKVTAREQRQRDSVNTRHAREEPDVFERERRRETVGRLVEETEDGRDVTKELEADESDDRAGLSPEE